MAQASDALDRNQIAWPRTGMSERVVHQMQRILADRVVFAPIWENGFIRAFGPRVEEAGLTLIQSFPYSAPLEEVRLKKQ